MVGMINKISIAISAGVISFLILWWIPIIVFPLTFFIIPSSGGGDYFQLSKSTIEKRRAIFYGISLVFIGLMTYNFQIHIGSWYGWLIGMLLGWLGCGSIAADLEKYLFFRSR
jgi:hypothetical protein